MNFKRIIFGDSTMSRFCTFIRREGDSDNKPSHPNQTEANGRRLKGGKTISSVECEKTRMALRIENPWSLKALQVSHTNTFVPLFSSFLFLFCCLSLASKRIGYHLTYLTRVDSTKVICIDDFNRTVHSN